MTASDAARPDERHSGAQQVYFLCFTDPVALSADEMRPYIDEHKRWLANVEASGVLFLAGPLLDDSFRFSGSGLMVLRAGSVKEARELLDSDPFHANGIRKYRLVPWQVNEGSVTLQVVLSSKLATLS
jgi:uncharacterized protein